MWHELTEESLANAIDRAYEERARTTQVEPGLVSVSCSSGMHPAGHLVEIERRGDSSLWGRCSVGISQGCPAEMSRRPCWHLAAAAPLFLALEGRGAATKDGREDDAVLVPSTRAYALPPEVKGGARRIVCALGTFERCARSQDAVNAVNRSLGLREIVYVEAAVLGSGLSAPHAREPAPSVAAY